MPGAKLFLLLPQNEKMNENTWKYEKYLILSPCGGNIVWSLAEIALNIPWIYFEYSLRLRLNWCTAGRICIHVVCPVSRIVRITTFSQSTLTWRATFHSFRLDEGIKWNGLIVFFSSTDMCWSLSHTSDYCTWRQIEAKLNWLTLVITGRMEVLCVCIQNPPLSLRCGPYHTCCVCVCVWEREKAQPNGGLLTRLHYHLCFKVTMKSKSMFKAT